MDRKALLYTGLTRLNGIVGSQAEWRALGRSCGYTAYGDLAGFFGGRDPSMVRRPDGSRELTAAWRRAGHT